MKQRKLNPAQISEIIALAWADEVSFSAIKQQWGLAESDVVRLMRRHLQTRSFKLWRKRVTHNPRKLKRVIRSERR